MTINDIKEKLVVKFSAPLRDYYKRHIIFWEDAEKEFSDSISELEIEGVTVINLSDNNTFKAKRMVNDESTGNLLIYDSTNMDTHKDWLADARIYADEVLRFDFYSMIIERIGAIESKPYRDAVKQYPKFWKSEERVEKLRKLCPHIKSEIDIHLAVLAVLSGAMSNNVAEILYNVFTNGLDTNDNDLIKKIESFGSIDKFWQLVNKFVGDCHNNLSNAFETFVVTALYQTMGSATPIKIKGIVSPQFRQECYSIVSEWTHNSDYDDIFDLIDRIDTKYSLVDLFNALSIDELAGSEIFSSINIALLNKLFSAASTKAIQGSKLTSIVESRGKMLWYKKYANYYESLMAIGNFFEIYDKYSDGFHYVKELEVWEDYQENLHLFDTYYRYIHYYVYKTSCDSIEEVEDMKKEALQYVENLYKNVYLVGLNDVWIKLIKEQMKETGRINETVKYQTMFFDNYVKKAMDDKLTFVIVSDGMRYEVAKDLAIKLQFKLKCDLKLDTIQSTFPAITKYGIPALLPGKKSVDDKMNVIVDGMKVSDKESRALILAKYVPESAVINYSELIAMNSMAKKEFIKGKKVIYIFHNEIDSSGHDSAGESKVFDSCEDTINKLLSLVQTLVNTRSSINVIITSDHGFIYSYNKLDETDKISIKSEEIVDAIGEKRCVVCKNPIDSEYLVEVKMLINNEDDSLIGYAPYQAIRMKSNGGPSNYVHGGLSLQETMVPVLIFDSVRTDSKAYGANKDKYNHNPAKIELVSTNRTLYSLIASLEFYQTKQSGLDAVEATYEAMFEDNMGNQVSDTVAIIANKTDPDAVNRRIKATITIKSNTPTGTYYLIIINRNTKETLIKEEFKINNDFGGDFDF